MLIISTGGSDYKNSVLFQVSPVGNRRFLHHWIHGGFVVLEEKWHHVLSRRAMKAGVWPRTKGTD